MTLTNAEKQQRFRSKHPEYVRLKDKARYPKRWATHLQRQYGLSAEDYEQMRLDQDGQCAICETTPRRRLNVDHDHKTGHVRGLLCGPCNRLLGQANDRPDILAAAVRYLLK